MAYHKKHHHRHHRRNPLGISGGVVKDAAWVAGGAIAAAALPGMIAPSMSTGWTGVVAKAAASVAASFLGRMVGGPVAAGEALKGGLAITLLAALKQGGVNVPGLGLYAPSWFGIPTASTQYLQASARVQPWRRFHRLPRTWRCSDDRGSGGRSKKPSRLSPFPLAVRGWVRMRKLAPRWFWRTARTAVKI